MFLGVFTTPFFMRCDIISSVARTGDNPRCSLEVMFNTANSYTLTIPETAAYLESVKQQPSFPPYNLLKRDGKYYMEMALAGYQEESLEVFEKEGTLHIRSTGKVEWGNEPKVEYVHQGIAQRSFKRSWKMPEHWVVKSANLKDGILTILFDEIIPEEKKPKYFLGSPE